MKYILFVLCLFTAILVNGQEARDSVTSSVQTSVLRNYPLIRPLNLEYDVNGGGRYQVKLGDKNFENGKVRKFNTLKFSATVPLLMRKQYYLLSTVSYNGLKVALTNIEGDQNLSSRNLNSGVAGLSTMLIWKDSLFQRTLILTAALNNYYDFSNGVHLLNGVASASLFLKTSVNERLSVGLAFSANRNSQIPFVPILNYYKRLNRYWELDILIPNKMAIRRQFSSKGWLSAGTELTTNNLFSVGNNVLSSGNFQTNFLSLRSGVNFEKYCNDFLLLGVKAGMQSSLSVKHQEIYASPNAVIATADRKLSPYLSLNLAFIPPAKRKP